MSKKGGKMKAPAQAPAQTQSAIQRYGGGQAGGGAMNWLPVIYLLGTPIMMGIGYLVIINPLLKKLGLKQDAEDKELEKLREEVMASPIWTPQFYQNNGGNSLTFSMAQTYAERLYDAMEGGWTGWGTDENEIAGVFNDLGSTGNVSIVSEAYQDMYGGSLINVLTSELNDKDFSEYVVAPISHYY
jgi:hypothetical protein